MAKVLFVNPVIREEDDPRHVPYGMALLAAIAMREGHLVQVYDANAWRAPESVLVQILKADRWDVIGVGGITTAYRSIKNIARISKEHAPQALVVAGGGFLTSMPHDILRLMPASGHRGRRRGIRVLPRGPAAAGCGQPGLGGGARA